MRKVLVLGATGRTGHWVLIAALKQDWSVHALVRDRRRISLSHPNLILFEGDVCRAEDMRDALYGCEGVISVLNVSRKSDFPWSPLRSPATLMSDAIGQVLSLAPKTGLRRLILCSASGVGDSWDQLPAWFRWLVKHSNIRYAYEDHDRQEEEVRKSDLEWTIVRPVGLSNSKRSERIYEYVGVGRKPGWMISRKSVARYMVEGLDRNDLIGKTVIISADSS